MTRSGGSGASGARNAGAETTLGLSAEDEDDVYLAPETTCGGYVSEKLDVFSLGAVGYRLFSETPPASTVAALNARLSSAGGLRLSDALDGLPGILAVGRGVRDRPGGRQAPQFSLGVPGSARGGGAGARRCGRGRGGRCPPARCQSGGTCWSMASSWNGASAKAPPPSPSRSSTTMAAECSRWPLDPSRNERIGREGEVLGVLRHPNIVAFYRHVELSGHAALFIAMAGTENRSGAYTLADRIREEGRLSLDLLERFGSQLLGRRAVAGRERHIASGPEARQHRRIRERRRQVARPRRVRLLARGHPRGEHPRGHAAVPGSVPAAAPATALGRLRRALRRGHDPPRDGDRKPARMGGRLDRPHADRGGSHSGRGVARSVGARSAHRILRQGAGQGLPGSLRQRGRDAPRVVRLLRGNRRPGHGRRGRWRPAGALRRRDPRNAAPRARPQSSPAERTRSPRGAYGRPSSSICRAYASTATRGSGNASSSSFGSCRSGSPSTSRSAGEPSTPPPPSTKPTTRSIPPSGASISWPPSSSPRASRKTRPA